MKKKVLGSVPAGASGLAHSGALAGISPAIRPAPEPRLLRMLGLEAVLAVIVLSFLTACKKEEPKGTVLAQVGLSTLTLEELQKQFPVEYAHLIKRDHYLDYVQRWIDDEVLFQEALSREMEKDPDVQRKIEALKRKVIIEEFLGGEEFSAEFRPDLETQKHYYEMHKHSFRRDRAVVKFQSMRLPSARAAWNVRQYVRADNFLELAQTHSQDSLRDVESFDRYRTMEEVDACLQEIAFGTRIGGVSNPIQCDNGFHVLRVVDKQDPGSIVPFDDVKEEIADLIAVEKKRHFLQSRIKEFKEGFAISFDLQKLPGQAQDKVPEELETALPVADEEESLFPHSDAIHSEPEELETEALVE